MAWAPPEALQENSWVPPEAAGPEQPSATPSATVVAPEPAWIPPEAAANQPSPTALPAPPAGSYPEKTLGQLLGEATNAPGKQLATASNFALSALTGDINDPNFDPVPTDADLAHGALSPEFFRTLLPKGPAERIAEAAFPGSMGGKIAEGIRTGLSDTGSSMTSPGNVGLMATLPALGTGKAAQLLLSGAFGAQAALALPDEMKAFRETTDPAEKAKIATGIVASLGLPALGAAHAAAPRLGKLLRRIKGVGDERPTVGTADTSLPIPEEPSIFGPPAEIAGRTAEVAPVEAAAPAPVEPTAVAAPVAEAAAAAPEAAKPAPIAGPALIDASGNVLAEGKLGQTHQQIFDEAMAKLPDKSGPEAEALLEALINDEQHAFTAESTAEHPNGEVLNRDQAAARADEFGQRPTNRTGPLQSEHLIPKAPAAAAEPAPAATIPKRAFELPHAPLGVQDIVDIVAENGGIKSKGSASPEQASLWEDQPDLRGVYRRVLGGKLPPDEMAAIAGEHGFGDGTVNSFWQELNKAVEARKSMRRQNASEASREKLSTSQGKKFEKDVLAPDTARTEINTSNLQVGDQVGVGSETFKVTSIDPDTLDVTLEDGKKYGVQQVTDGKAIYVDHAELVPRDQSFLPGEAPAPAEAPQLRPGEKGTGDLFQGADQPFNLVGEKGTDFAAKQAEATAAEQRAAEAKALQDQQQTEFPIGDEIMSPGPGAAAAGENLASYEARRFGTRFQEDQKIAPEIREATGNRYYEPIPNAVTVAEAEKIIEQRGTDESIRLVRDESFPIAPRVRVTVGEALIRKLNQSYEEAKAAGDSQAEAFLGQAVDTAEYLGELGTTLGQGVQAFAIWNRLTPEGILLEYKRIVQKARVNKGGDAIRSLIRKIKNINAAAADKVSQSAEIVKAVAKLTDPGSPLWNRYRDAAAAKLATVLKGPTPPGREAAIQVFTSRLVENIREKFQSDQPKAKAPVLEITDEQVIKEAFNNFEKYQDVWNATAKQIEATYQDNPEALQTFREFFDQGIGEPFSRKTIGNIVKKEIASASIDLGALVRDHYSKLEETTSDLTQKIVDRMGLSEADAKVVANAVAGEFQKAALKEKAAALRSLVKDNPTLKPVLSKADQIIQLSNMGALSEQTFYDAVGERLGLPKYDPNVAKKLMKMAEEIRKAPAGFQKNEKTMALTSYMADIKGANPADIPTALWYSNILSGYSTQLVNTIDTAINVLSESAAMGLSHPKSIPNIIAGLYQGMIRGGFEAANTLKTGKSSAGDKIMQDRILERAKFGVKGGVPVSAETPIGAFMKKAFESKLATPLNLWKYPLRAMIASDTVFFHSMKEARAQVLARSLAKTEGLSGEPLFKRVEEVLNNSPIVKDEAVKQAQSEGLTGLQQRRRVQEIIEQGRPQDLIDNSREAAEIATYNHDPSGVLGLVAENVSNITKGFPLAKAIVPFTRIVANVTNRGLNYTPWGYKRLFFGEWGGRKFGTPAPVDEAFRTQLVKATLGTTAMTAVALLDANNTIQVTAKGPENPEQRHQLQTAGWKPYSVKIGDEYFSYQYTPFQLGFSMIGHYRDAIRYNKLSEKDAATRLAYGMLKAGSAVLDQSFLSGVSDFIETLQGQASSTKSAGKLFARTASSVFTPNLVKQIDKLFDPTLQQADSVTEALIRETPIARQSLKPMLNVLGEPIKQAQNRFFTSETKDPIWKFITEKQAWVPVPSKTSKIGDRPITGDEYYRLIKESGPQIREFIESNLDELKNMTGEQAQDLIRKQSEQIRKGVKAGF